MSNRWFRFVIALLAISVAAAAAYRIFQHEQRLADVVATTHAGEYAAESAITTISEIKAALHAYVVPGQARDFWTKRASTLIERLRASLVELERSASRTDVSLTDELDPDRLAAADKRARTHLSAEQLLLAGEVIFTEARDVLDAMQLAVAATRNGIREASERRTVEIRREQTILALGAAAVMVMAVLVLVPPGRPASASARGSSDASYGETSPKRPAREGGPALPVPARESSNGSSGQRSDRRPKVRVGSIAPATGDPLAAPGAPSAPAAPAASASARGTSEASYGETSPKRPEGREDGPTVFLADAAAVCTDLGRVSQSNEISALLGRAADVLSASGVIVWVASENRDELFPAAASGYNERLFERIGSIPRDASNLTASSFRSGVSKTTASREGSPSALAVPLLTPHGPVGVFSAELRDISEIDTDRLAVAAIFAAQLASLLGSISASTESVSEAQAQNG